MKYTLLILVLLLSMATAVMADSNRVILTPSVTIDPDGEAGSGDEKVYSVKSSIFPNVPNFNSWARITFFVSDPVSKQAVSGFGLTIGPFSGAFSQRGCRGQAKTDARGTLTVDINVSQGTTSNSIMMNAYLSDKSGHTSGAFHPCFSISPLMPWIDSSVYSGSISGNGNAAGIAYADSSTYAEFWGSDSLLAGMGEGFDPSQRSRTYNFPCDAEHSLTGGVHIREQGDDSTAAASVNQSSSQTMVCHMKFGTVYQEGIKPSHARWRLTANPYGIAYYSLNASGSPFLWDRIHLKTPLSMGSFDLTVEKKSNTGSQLTSEYLRLDNKTIEDWEVVTHEGSTSNMFNASLATMAKIVGNQFFSNVFGETQVYGRIGVEAHTYEVEAIP